jgi:hypothetical protein
MHLPKLCQCPYNKQYESLQANSIAGTAMDTALQDRRFLEMLRENPLDLRRMNAADAAHALFDFIQTEAQS